MLRKDEKKKMIDKFKLNENDTGSIQVQVAALTDDIKRLTEHLQTFPKDFSAKRGLLKLVSRRRGFIKYLKRNNEEDYNAITKKLGIKD